MDEIQYVGERLWAGELGHLFVLISFVAGIVATLAYTMGTNAKDLTAQNGWLQMGRWSFMAHGVSVWAVIGLLFAMLVNKYYEYEYVWAHASDDLPFKYVFSAFWEGQEGSFLLWAFWHVVLGFVLMKYAKSWESPVMAVVALVNTIVMSMLLGIYITSGDARLGSSPFVLMRDMNFAPIFNTPTYLEQVKGNGLNPLLQNYWMTIHPPTLFLGFASTVVPFAYAIAGLWLRKHTEWIRPALAWSLFSAAILGTGILMGGAWAYEALSFGGYWAWDPVENASLVPWITLVAGIHTALVAQHTGHSIRGTYFFLLSSFILIIYSTFLTRSGILGETSAHSFTEMGLEWQLVGFMAIPTAISLYFYLRNGRDIPTPEKEESSYSKEFWLFIGSLVLLFSAALITYTTSIPVFNKVLGTKIAPPEDVVDHHNRFQLWIGVFISLLSAVAQFMRYRIETPNAGYKQFFFRHIGLSAGVALAIGLPLMLWSGIAAWQYWLLVITGLFTIVANLDYIVAVVRGKVAVSGSAVAHIGFGFLMVGAVFSGALKQPISMGFTSLEEDALGGLNKQTNKQVLLIKNRTEKIAGGYEVTYSDEWEDGNAHYFALKFVQRGADSSIINEFTTTPNVLKTKQPDGSFKFAAANPNTKHYLGQDVFTLAIPDWAFQSEEDKKEDTASWKTNLIKEGDTIYTSNNYIVLTGLNTAPKHPDYVPMEGDIAIAAQLMIHNIEGRTPVIASPVYCIRGNTPLMFDAKLAELGLELRLARIVPDEQKFQIEVRDSKPKQAYVVMQALLFPLINLVWLGSILMMLGLTMGMWQKIKQRQAEA